MDRCPTSTADGFNGYANCWACRVRPTITRRSRRSPRTAAVTATRRTLPGLPILPQPSDAILPAYIPPGAHSPDTSGNPSGRAARVKGPRMRQTDLHGQSVNVTPLALRSALNSLLREYVIGSTHDMTERDDVLS